MPEDVHSLAEKIRSTECIRVISVFSHLAGSEDPSLDHFSRTQVEVFLAALGADKGSDRLSVSAPHSELFRNCTDASVSV